MKRGLKRFFNKKILSIILAACITFGAAGCTSDGDVVVYGDNGENKTPISLAWWGNDARVTYTMDGVSVFEQLNPDISVKCKYGVWAGYTRRQNIYMLSHDEPDVMQVNFDWIKTYSPDGKGFYDMYKLTDYIDLSNFTDADLSYGTVEGRLNAIPIALNTHCIFVNKDVYDQYGLDIPKTWDDFFEDAKVMREDGIYPISMGDKQMFFFVLAYFEQTTGKEACDKDGSLILERDDIKIMLDFYKKLHKEKVLMPIQTSDFSAFANKLSASCMRWISGSQTMFNGLFNENVNIVPAPFPTVDGSMDDVKSLDWYVKPATLYAISNKTEHQEEAAKLVNFLLNSPEMARLQQTEKGVPISKTARKVLEDEGYLDNLDFIASEQMFKYGDKLKLMHPILEKEDVFGVFFNESAYYIYDERTLDETAETIYNKWYKK
ncbi:MAG: carbohydrate ABC transporter substrate-binding protein [Firmicutes bacterium]|nr:carbohydrate ABC transporter substrate-binding protein [Bacillota bacterium]